MIFSALEPVLNASDQSILLETSLEKALPLYAALARLSHDESSCADASLTAGVELLESMERLVINLLRLSLDPGGMDMVFTLLLPWSKGQEEALRRNSLRLLKLALVTLSKEVEYQPGAPTRFSQGHLMISKV